MSRLSDRLRAVRTTRASFHASRATPPASNARPTLHHTSTHTHTQSHEMNEVHVAPTAPEPPKRTAHRIGTHKSADPSFCESRVCGHCCHGKQETAGFETARDDMQRPCSSSGPWNQRCARGIGCAQQEVQCEPRVQRYAWALYPRRLYWHTGSPLSTVSDSIVASISACHADDPGSIPGRRAFLHSFLSLGRGSRCARCARCARCMPLYAAVCRCMPLYAAVPAVCRCVAVCRCTRMMLLSCASYDAAQRGVGAGEAFGHGAPADCAAACSFLRLQLCSALAVCKTDGAALAQRESSKTKKLSDRELNPGRPRDRRKY